MKLNVNEIREVLKKSCTYEYCESCPLDNLKQVVKFIPNSRSFMLEFKNKKAFKSIYVQSLTHIIFYDISDKKCYVFKLGECSICEKILIQNILDNLKVVSVINDIR